MTRASRATRARLADAGARLGRGARRIGGALRRTHPLTLLAMVAVLAVAIAVAVRVADPDRTGQVAGSAPVRVGVNDGDSVPAYMEASRRELTELAAYQGGPVYALVTLDDYTDPEGVAAVLATGTANAGLSTVVALARVPLSGRQTEIVRLPAQRLPSDLHAGMTEVAQRKAADAASYAERAAAEPDAARRALYASTAEVSEAESRAYAAGCACVYAVVVRGEVTTLQALGEDPRVRAVDPAPEIVDLTRTVIVAPLPEHVDIVQPLPDDLTSSDGATPAVRSS